MEFWHFLYSITPSLLDILHAPFDSACVSNGTVLESLSFRVQQDAINLLFCFEHVSNFFLPYSAVYSDLFGSGQPPAVLWRRTWDQAHPSNSGVPGQSFAKRVLNNGTRETERAMSCFLHNVCVKAFMTNLFYLQLWDGIGSDVVSSWVSL